MAQKIRPQNEDSSGDGFQFKPEKVLVASREKTTKLKILTAQTTTEVVYVEREEFVVAKYVRRRSIFSLEFVLTFVSTILTAISIWIYFQS